MLARVVVVPLRLPLVLRLGVTPRPLKRRKKKRRRKVSGSATWETDQSEDDGVEC